MPTLYLMRHAQAEGESPSGLDVDRKLSSYGQEQARRAAQWLSQQQSRPTTILASPAQRTRQTALALCKTLEIPATRIHWEARVYSASAGVLLELLRPYLNDENLVMVGHNPGLEALVRSFAPSLASLQSSQQILGLAPASIAQIDWPSPPINTNAFSYFTQQAQLQRVVSAHTLE